MFVEIEILYSIVQDQPDAIKNYEPEQIMINNNNEK